MINCLLMLNHVKVIERLSTDTDKVQDAVPEHFSSTSQTSENEVKPGRCSYWEKLSEKRFSFSFPAIVRISLT